jgi:hypothetical protein
MRSSILTCETTAVRIGVTPPLAKLIPTGWGDHVLCWKSADSWTLESVKVSLKSLSRFATETGHQPRLLTTMKLPLCCSVAALNYFTSALPL